jgi:N-carbamoyl-L-amino-acid hydrolase
MRISFHGRGDHAGTTPLYLRADALVAAAQFVSQAPQLVQQRFPTAVVTCGDITVKPGVYNVVPNNVTVLAEFRASSEDTLSRMEQALLSLVETCTAVSDDLSFTTTATGRCEPVGMASSIQAAMAQASEALSYPTMILSSGALHDAGVLASVVPSGMIFVPSINGGSHCPQEDTATADLVAGANVLLHTALILAQGQRHQTAGTQ